MRRNCRISVPSTKMSLRKEDEDRCKGLEEGSEPNGLTEGLSKPVARTGSMKEQRPLDVETGSESSETDQNLEVDNVSSLLHGQIRFDHFAAATGLMVTYVIEIIVQVLLLVECFRPVVSTSVSSPEWRWLMTTTFIGFSMVVTGVSLVWVCRSLDFAGRLCGRLLCYVMHFFMLGLLWRFLKLAFVYDGADVQEFVMLRKFQTLVQSIPVAAVHVAWLIQAEDNWSSVILGIVVLELLSILTALVLSTYVKADDQCIKSKGDVMKMIARNLNCSSSCGESKDCCKGCSGFMETKLHVLSRSLLLCCRLLVVGIIIVDLKYWTCLFLLAHFIVSFTWISFTVNNHSSSSGNILVEDISDEMLFKDGKDYVFRILEWSYVLFWDVTWTLDIPVCTWILPVILVLLENGSTILFYWYRHPNPTVVLISTCCLAVGWILFCCLNFFHYDKNMAKCFPPTSFLRQQSSPDNKSSKGQQHGGQILPVVDPLVAKEQSQKDHPAKIVHEEAVNKGNSLSDINSIKNGKDAPSHLWHANELPSVILAAIGSDYDSIDQVVSQVRNSNRRTLEKMTKNGKKMERDLPEGIHSMKGDETRNKPFRQGNGLRSSGSLDLATTTWVPDTCCNDSNGSSNSRNTNTLREPESHDPDETDVENSNFVFYYPATDPVVQQSVISARFLKCSERLQQPANQRNLSPILATRDTSLVSRTMFSTPPVTAAGREEDFDEKAGRKKSRRSCSSLSSSVNIRRYRTSTPVEIKKASRIMVNGGPSLGSSKAGGTREAVVVPKSRCQCGKNVCSSQDVINGRGDHSSYDRLMEDSYKILICEDETPCGTQPPPVYKDSSRSNGRCKDVKSEFSSSSSGSPQPSPSRVLHLRPAIFAPAAKKLKVLCAKCLQNHDPLLSNCIETESLVQGDHRSQVLLALKSTMKKSKSSHDHQLGNHNFHHHHHHHVRMADNLKSAYPGGRPGSGRPSNCWEVEGDSSAFDNNNTFDEIITDMYEDDDDIVVIEDEYDIEEDEALETYTTDYPSGTEMTCTAGGDDLSVSSHLSTATYTTWPHPSQPNLSMWTTSTMMPPSRFPKEFTSLEYVRTWLLTSQARQGHRFDNQVAKKVYRSNTMSAQSRRVRFAAVGTKSNTCKSNLSARNHSHDKESKTRDSFTCNPPKPLLPNPRSRRHHRRRQGQLKEQCRPGGSVDLIENYHLISRSSVPQTVSMPLHQPPPRQKQHPLLPHRVVPNKQKGTHSVVRSRHLTSDELIDAFYKDVEIIL